VDFAQTFGAYMRVNFFGFGTFVPQNLFVIFHYLIIVLVSLSSMNIFMDNRIGYCLNGVMVVDINNAQVIA